MDAETWMTAAEAVAHGFVDRITEKSTAKNTWNLASFDKAPKALLEPAAPEPEQPTIGFFMAVANTKKLALIQAL